MSTINRLEAMDAVVNLQEISKVLGEEQSENGRHELVREFPLKYVKATDVQKQLEKFLGIDSGGGLQMMPGMDPNQMAMIQQQQAAAAAMQAQMAAQAGGAAPSPARKVEVRLVSDMVRNRIIAHGPPDKIALIESFIRVADVPTNGAQSLDAMLKRVKVFRLASLDADQFVQSMNEIGGLDPMTRLRADTKNNAVMVDGSLVDQFTIKSLIEKLDGSGRRFEVIQLRRNSAEEVAGSIEMLMGGDEKEQQNNNRRYYGWDFYGYGGNNDNKSKDKFRVGANVEYNQLLLWANDIELTEVRKLLVKLDEIDDPDGGGRRVRTIEIPRGQSHAEILKRLQEAWPSLSPNQDLELPPTDSLPKVKEEQQEEKKAGPENPMHDTQQRIPKNPAADLITQTFIQATTLTDVEAATTPETKTVDNERPPAPKEEPSVGNPPATNNPPETNNPPARREPTIEDLLRQDAEQFQESQRPSSPPPVRISVGSDGNLIISSDDPAALNKIEDFFERIIPPAKNYQVFKLKYAAPLWVRFNLEDFFKEDKDENAEMRRWWYGDEEPSDSRRQLGKKKKIKFIDDLDTNTIVVVGADEEQLAVIEDLIKLYDVPEQVNQQNTRVTKLFHIKYSKASLITATIKDAFIDLLSSNDKALQGAQQGGGNPQGERPTATIIRNYGPPMAGGDEQREKRTSITFKGKLSLGVDDVTNTIIVSAEGESLLNIVGEIIDQLDQAAIPEAHFAVVPFAGSKNYDHLQKSLQALLGSSQGQPNGAPPQGQQPPPQQPYPGYPPQQPQPQPQPQPVIIED
jgi:type II secretory pathway component GspD/PulD (secretin)